MSSTVSTEFSIDTHVATALFEDRQTGLTRRERHEVREQLRRLVKQGSLKFVISDFLARELAPIVRDNVELYARTINYWYILAGRRFLMTGPGLLKFEVANQRKAVGDERFITEDHWQEVMSNAVDPWVLYSVSQRDHDSGAMDKDSMQKMKEWMRNEVFGTKQAAGKARELIDKHFERAVQHCCLEIMHTDHENLWLPTDPKTWPDPNTIPTLRQVASYMVALWSIIVGENRKTQSSHQGDAAHYAVATVVDVFVSDDAVFNEVYERIPSKPFRLLTFPDFLDEFCCG